MVYPAVGIVLGCVGPVVRDGWRIIQPRRAFVDADEATPDTAAVAVNYVSDESPRAREHALSHVSEIARESPQQVVYQSEQSLDSVLGLLAEVDVTSPETGQQASEVLRYFAVEYPEEAVVFNDALVDSLETGSVQTRVNAVVAGAMIASFAPDNRHVYEQHAIELAGQVQDSSLQKDTCYALSRIGTRQARERVEAIAEGGSEDVMAYANDVLASMDW